MSPFPKPNLKTDFERFRTLISGLNETEKSRIYLAVTTAERWHKNQFRADGTEYLTHLLRVASYVLMIHPDCPSTWIEAALLHDILEDTTIGKSEIFNLLGTETLQYVSLLTRNRGDQESHKERAEAKENKIKEISSAPVPVRTVKAWDVADNFLSVRFISAEAKFFSKIPRWIAEAQDFQIPFCEEHCPIAANLMKLEIAFLANLGIVRGKRDVF